MTRTTIIHPDLFLTVPCPPAGYGQEQEFGLVLHFERLTKQGKRFCYGGDFYATPQQAYAKLGRIIGKGLAGHANHSVLAASCIAGAAIGAIHNQRGRLTWSEYSEIDFESLTNQAVEAVDAYNRKTRKLATLTSSVGASSS